MFCVLFFAATNMSHYWVEASCILVKPEAVNKPQTSSAAWCRGPFGANDTKLQSLGVGRSRRSHKTLVSLKPFELHESRKGFVICHQQALLDKGF